MNGLPSWLAVVPQRPGAVLGFGMALIVCVGVAVSLRGGDRLKSLDEAAFLDLGGNLAFRFSFAHTNRPEIEGYDPRLSLSELRPTAYRAPGYAWLLAPFRRLGAGYAGLRILNFLLVALTLALSWSLLLRRAGPLGATVGVALVFSYPVLFYAAATLYPQTLVAFLLVAVVWSFDRLDRTAKPLRYALAGVLHGLLALTAPLFLLLAPIPLAWLIWSRRATARQASIVVFTLAAAVLVWMGRNTLLFRAPAGLATSSGFNLLAGNGPYVRYDQATTDMRWPAGVRERVAGRNELERDRIMTGAALRWMADNPGAASLLYLKKLLYWFAFRNDLASDRIVPGGSGAGPPWLRDAIMALGYGLLLAILILRLARLRRHPLHELEVLLLALYLGGGIAYAIYFTRIRFRLPFDWLLIAFDAMFLARLLGGARREGPLPGRQSMSTEQRM